jgi:hypothetical protein
MSSNGAPIGSGVDLDLWGQLRVVRRCLPLLRGVRRHLVVLLLGMAVLAIIGFASFLVYAPALWNGTLQGKPISEFAARAVGLAPELVARVESLTPPTALAELHGVAGPLDRDRGPWPSVKTGSGSCA